MTKVNGKVIGSPVLGRMTSGHSMQVVQSVNAILRWLYKATDHFSKHLEEICEAYDLEPTSAGFKLRLGETTFEIYEKVFGKTLLNYPYEFQFDSPASNVID